MNIEYLKYFSELAKIQHYGKAAKALNISQPGLSHAIKSLEEEYGGFRTLQEQIFAEEGIKVKPVCAAEEIEVITGLVENGFGISVLPYMDIVRLHNVVTIPVKTSGWNSKFYIARRKYGIRSEQEEAFFQYWKKKHH